MCTIPGYRAVLFLIAGSLLVACGGKSSAPSPAPAPLSPSPPVTLTGEVVDALSGDRIPGVQVRTLSEQTTTDTNGMFRLSLAAPPSIGMTLSRAGFVDRQTQAAVPGPVQLSLISSTFDLAALEQFAPRAGGLRRWMSNPRVVFLKSVVDYAFGTEFLVTDRELSAAVVACTTRHVAEDITALTGGHLELAGLDVVSAEVRSRFALGSLPEGTIVIMAARSLGSNGRGAAYSGSQPFVIARGGVWLNADDLPFCSAQADFVVLHELGHAMGYAPNHVSAPPSVMGSPPTSALTPFDRDAIALVYQRPPGNRAPDVDPSTAVMGRDLARSRVVRRP